MGQWMCARGAARDFAVVQATCCCPGPPLLRGTGGVTHVSAGNGTNPPGDGGRNLQL